MSPRRDDKQVRDVASQLAVPVVGLSESFDRFYRREFPGVVALCYALSRRSWAAEELAQEAFLRAYRNWERIGRYDQPGAWVKRVAINLALSGARRWRAEARALARAALDRSSREDESHMPSDAFWKAVRSLPKRQAQVIVLFYVEDRAAADIASVLGIAESTVRAHLTNGRRALAKRLRLEVEDPL